MAASTRARVAAMTLDSPLTTRETVFSPTPASAATSRMVACRTRGNAPDNVFSSTASQHRTSAHGLTSLGSLSPGVVLVVVGDARAIAERCLLVRDPSMSRDPVGVPGRAVVEGERLLPRGRVWRDVLPREADADVH